MEVEWTALQQVEFLAESIPVGVALGIVLDIFNGIGRVHRSRMKQFYLDVLFAVFAAVITFFSSLVIMDGQLHPILFVGIAFGAAAMHLLLGKYIAKFVFVLFGMMQKSILVLSGVFQKGAFLVKNLVKRLKMKRFYKKRLEIFDEAK